MPLSSRAHSTSFASGAAARTSCNSSFREAASSTTLSGWLRPHALSRDAGIAPAVDDRDPRPFEQLAHPDGLHRRQAAEENTR